MNINIKKTATAIAGAVTAGGAIVTGKKIMDKTFCPVCTAKKILNKVVISQQYSEPYNNDASSAPPMGWSSWNLFRHKINEQLIKEIADAMADSGLAECGYKYVNIDDCWQASTRDAEGRLQCDKINFPSGIKSLAEYVNSKGVKLGIYSSNGTYTCEDYPASLRNERIDAETFASWGIEYFKYDFCHNVPIPSLAPRIIAVAFADKENGNVIKRYTSADMTLKGMARIVLDDSIEDKNYIDGLDSGNGSFTVEIDVQQEGEYILHIDIRKDARSEKFIMARVNGCDEYHIYCVSRKNWTPEGKLQQEVHLKKGLNVVELTNPIGSRMDSAAVQYKLMGRELKRATKKYADENGVKEKPIVYSICEWGFNRPWKWGAQAGNLWRTTPDIRPVWSSVLSIYEHNVRLYKYAHKGAWNDPDMLEVGNGDLTIDENKAHFSLWCMMASPLILGNDIRKFIKEDGTVDTDSRIYSILTNKAMISIDQDPLGIQCKRIKFGFTDVLIKPLVDNKVAVCVFNKSNKMSEYNVCIDDIAKSSFVNLSEKEYYDVYDVWDDKKIEQVKNVNACCEKHGVKVYIIE